MKKTSVMKKLYERLHDSRAFWMVVSLLASLTIWVYVTSMQSDQYTSTFRNVEVSLVGEDELRTSKNMVITDLDTSTVTVQVTGPRRIVAGLAASDIKACVDVSKLSRSAYTTQQYYISYPEGIDTSNIDDTSRSPSTISFMVSPLNTKTVQVRGSFDGSLAEGYTAETPVFEPATITVSGADAYLKDVSYAWVSFGKEDVDSTYKVETGFTLMNENGQECSTVGLTCSEDVVTATLPLLLVKEVPLSVDVIEGAGATKANTKIKVEPDSITLAGDSSLLTGMNKIVLDTIDLTDFTSTFSETYTIPIDNQMNNLTGVTEAKVTVEVVGLETRTYKVKNISCINVTNGFTADIISESIDVVIRGTPERLDELKGDNIRAVADLTDYNESTGQFMPTVKIVVDGFTDVGAVKPSSGDYTISIEIRKA